MQWHRQASSGEDEKAIDYRRKKATSGEASVGILLVEIGYCNMETKSAYRNMQKEKAHVKIEAAYMKTDLTGQGIGDC